MAYGKGFTENKITAQVDGTALTNTTTATSILPPQAKQTLEPQNGSFIGKKYRVRAAGRISTAASTPGNLTLDIRFGSVVVATSQAMALATSQTNIAFIVEWDLTVRAVLGATTGANIMHQGIIFSAALTGSPILMPASAPAVGTGYDNSASQAVDFFATFSAASASNSITLHQFELTEVN